MYHASSIPWYNTNTWCQTTRERNPYMYWTQYNMAIGKQANTNSFEMGVKVWWQQSHTYEYVNYKCVTLFVFGDDCQQQIKEEIVFNLIPIWFVFKVWILGDVVANLLIFSYFNYEDCKPISCFCGWWWSSHDRWWNKVEVPMLSEGLG